MKKQLGMAATPPHPESVIHAPAGRVVPLKVHRCLWSGTHPENSLPAIEECYRDVVARAEIDVHLLRDSKWPTTESTFASQWAELHGQNVGVVTQYLLSLGKSITMSSPQ